MYVGQGNSRTLGLQGVPPRGPQVSLSTRRGTAAAAADHGEPCLQRRSLEAGFTQNDGWKASHKTTMRGRAKQKRFLGGSQTSQKVTSPERCLTTLPSGPIYGAGAGQKAGCGPDGLGQSPPPHPQLPGSECVSPTPNSQVTIHKPSAPAPAVEDGSFRGSLGREGGAPGKGSVHLWKSFRHVGTPSCV